MNKIYIILIMVLLLMSLTFVVAKEDVIAKWFEKEKPSDVLSVQQETKLIADEKYIWQTTKYWQEGNCYYYDLSIGNTTDTTWSDPRRELKCFVKPTTLTDGEISDLQIADVKTTLKQLGTPPTVIPIQSYVASPKSEDLKNKKIYEEGLEVIVK